MLWSETHAIDDEGVISRFEQPMTVSEIVTRFDCGSCTFWYVNENLFVLFVYRHW